MYFDGTERSRITVTYSSIMILPVLVTLSVLASNAFAASLPSVYSQVQSMITDIDRELFIKGEGLWFLDDEKKPVRATLEVPIDTRALASMDTHVLFHLYTKDIEKGEYEQIKINDEKLLKNSHFDSNRPTKLITHGWVNSKRSDACTMIRDAYMQRGDYNIIVIDWSKITLRPYGWAAAHVKKVGKHVAKMIDFLELQGVNTDNMTLAGHSLGAHVMGLAGYYAKSNVNYVVGLDPAYPLFTQAGKGSRISKEDAQHVEIIHTNAGLLGYPKSIGKADFYPNGGKKQLGCIIDIGGICSHIRSYEFYAESLVTKTGFFGQKCKDYDEYTQGDCQGEVGVMGGAKTYLPYNGTYYLTTRSKNPFAMGPK